MASRNRSQPIDLDAFQAGYPRYAALLSTDSAFQNFRRFTRCRMRLLLAKQDRLCVLEQELELIDKSEASEIFLGCMRRDTNQQRRQKFQELDEALADYDELLLRAHQSCCLVPSSCRDLNSLLNWHEGTASIARHETAYLTHEFDLINLADRADDALSRILQALETCAVYLEDQIMPLLPPCLRRRLAVVLRKLRSNHLISRDEHIFVPSEFTKSASRLLTILVATVTLVVPAIMLSAVSSTTVRIGILFVSAAIFLAAVSGFTRASTMELFTAGASYAAVLVVFMSGTQNTCRVGGPVATG